MDMRACSIIVPVYNTEQYLERCVDSILEQTFADFELILVDDGSSDRSRFICDEYAQRDSRVRVIHKENGGVSSARNHGIVAATGKYLMFCDSDDYVSSDWCQKMIEVVQEHSDAWIVCGVEKHYNTSSLSLYPPGDRTNLLILPKEDYFTVYKSYLSAYSWNKIYNRKIIIEHAVFFDETIKNGEDIEFNIRYFQYIKKIACVPCVTYHYNCENEHSEMGRYNPKRFDNSRFAYQIRKTVIAERYMSEYQTMWFSRFVGDLRYVFDKRNVWGFIKKISYCSAGLKSGEFRECLRSADSDGTNAIYRKLLMKGNYLWIYLWDLLRRIIRK